MESVGDEEPVYYKSVTFDGSAFEEGFYKIQIVAEDSMGNYDVYSMSDAKVSEVFRTPFVYTSSDLIATCSDNLVYSGTALTPEVTLSVNTSNTNELRKNVAANWLAAIANDQSASISYSFKQKKEWDGTDVTNAVAGSNINAAGLYEIYASITYNGDSIKNESLGTVSIGRPSISKTVTFKVVNGAWDNGETTDKTVTLTGLEGDTLKLLATQIPAVGTKPAAAYKAGSWNVVPSTDTEITADTVYTYTYVYEPEPEPVNPEPEPEPVNPEPVNPEPVNPEPVNPGPQNPIENTTDNDNDSNNKMNIELAAITCIRQFDYTGRPIERDVEVEYEGISLEKNKDFTVSYSNNIDVGTGSITITGIGDWTGEVKRSFEILPKTVKKDFFSVEDVEYKGKAIEAPVVAKDGDKELELDKDYTVVYKNNTEVGTATAMITGKGNYTGSVDVTFEILGKPIKGATVSDLKTVAYTGKAITPAVTVKLDGKTLKKGTDYTVTYKNNTKVGTATVTITGKGDYSGTITKKFLIKKISFKYRAYVQKKNWMAWSTAKVSGTSASKMAGTTDNLRMETIQMQLAGVSGAIKYRAYVEKMGWTQWATTADTTTYAGTKGMSRRVEMIQLQASGQVATLYDMYYRAYSEKFGWLGWAKSGEKAGTAGYALKLEAFQVNFVRKGESFTVKSDRTKCFYDKTKDGANPK